MKKATITVTASTIFTAGIAPEHGGATGIVKERMDGMTAMQNATKAVTPIMRGAVAYDADAVRSFAMAVEAHSGETMTKLFPEGSGGMPSETKEAVWSEWKEFEELGIRLDTFGQALEKAAGNGLAAGGDQSDASMAGTGGMMGGQTATGGMMGYQMATDGMMGQSDSAMMNPKMLVQMPADAVFTQVMQTCSACHTKFSAESN